jgi:hypothetical protein
VNNLTEENGMKLGRHVTLGLAIAIMTGCGQSSDKSRSAAGVQGEDANSEGEVLRDHIIEPPKEYYDAALADRMLSLNDPSKDQVMWINFEGAQLSKGFQRGQSFILCRANATIPPANLSAADKDNIVDQVQEHYDVAGAKIILTTQKPTSGDFTTIHVGGSYSDLGWLGGGVLGVAPFDVGNTNRNDIGFAFTSGVNSNAVIAETVSHEAGHSFGLDHVNNRRDIMHASSTSTIEGFFASPKAGGRIQDAPAILQQVLGMKGSNSTPANPPSVQPTATPTTPAPNPGAPSNPSNPTPPVVPGLPNIPIDLANLPGLIPIGNIGSILNGMGGGNLPIDISQILPGLGSLIPGGVNGAGGIPGIDQIIAAIGIAGAAGGSNLIPGLPAIPGLPGLGALPGGGFQDILDMILGGAGIANLGGVLNNPAGIDPQLIQNIIGMIGGGNLPIGNVGAIPDLSQILGLVGGAGGSIPGGASPAAIADLINKMTQTGSVISANYSGAQRDALLSLLKVSYAQAYAKTK